ncbi:MAG TPA: flavin reductase family protein [Bacteroidales bacterium]|nr:flavin reductase family protein [Bacteroidales bacterium]
MKSPTGPFDYFRETMERLQGDGILLVAGDPPNPMTIGWATIGTIWHRPVMTVLVRPTRYTFHLMEEASDFSVCVLPDKFEKHLAFCGTKSGKDHDKIKVCGFTLKPGKMISTPYIAESGYHFECRTIHRHKLDPDRLDESISKRFYPKKDFHTVYYGEIVGAFGRD